MDFQKIKRLSSRLFEPIAADCRVHIKGHPSRKIIAGLSAGAGTTSVDPRDATGLFFGSKYKRSIFLI